MHNTIKIFNSHHLTKRNLNFLKLFFVWPLLEHQHPKQRRWLTLSSRSLALVAFLLFSKYLSLRQSVTCPPPSNMAKKAGVSGLGEMEHDSTRSPSEFVLSSKSCSSTCCSGWYGATSIHDLSLWQHDYITLK